MDCEDDKGVGEIMETIWKYQLDVCSDQLVQLPTGAEILTAQVQHGTVQMWACVDPDSPLETHHIRIHGTGHCVLNHDKLKYISTFQLQNGNLVFHVFEVLK